MKLYQVIDGVRVYIRRFRRHVTHNGLAERIAREVGCATLRIERCGVDRFVFTTRAIP